MSSLCSENKSNSFVNTHKCAIGQTLASLGNDKFVSSLIIARFMKGISNLKSPIPTYKEFWDVRKVLKFLASQFPLESLSVKMLTLKTIALLALSTAKRSQTLGMLMLWHYEYEPDRGLYCLLYTRSTLDIKIR